MATTTRTLRCFGVGAWRQGALGGWLLVAVLGACAGDDAHDPPVEGSDASRREGADGSTGGEERDAAAGGMRGASDSGAGGAADASLDATTGNAADSAIRGATPPRADAADTTAPAPCLDPTVGETLSAYLGQLMDFAPEVSAGVGPLEYSSFMAAPGMPAPPATYVRGQRARSCSGSSIDAAVCSDPDVPDGPTSCASFECTGDGSGWRTHRLPEPASPTLGDFHYVLLIVSTRYDDDDQPGITFFSAAEMSGPDGRDYSFEARGRMQDEALEVTVLFSALFAAGEAELTFTAAPPEGSGSLKVAGLELATLDANAELHTTATCPGG